MRIHRRILYVCVLPLNVALFLLCSPSEAQQSTNQKPITLTPKIRREARDLANRYRRANQDIEKCAEIAAQAIQRGRPYAEKVLEIAAFANAKQLEAYGKSFNKQIEKAKIITPAGIVASSEKLQSARKRLLQFAEIESQLRLCLQNNPPVAQDGQGDKKVVQENKDAVDGKSADDHKRSANEDSVFAKSLRGLEDRTANQWLVNRGYGRLTDDEKAVIASINRLRQQAGLGELEVDYKLCFAARDHSSDMLRKQFFSHTSPVKGKKTFAHRAYRVGTQAYAENIARCNKGESPVSLWINSKPHKRNMYGKGFNTIGVGRAGNNYTAMFGRKSVKKSEKPAPKK